MAFRDALEHIFQSNYLARIVSHIALLVLVSAVAVFSQMRWNVAAQTEAETTVVMPIIEPDMGVGGPEFNDIVYPTVIPSPLPNIPKHQRSAIEQYTVQSNDNVSRIADKFEIKPETILWANPQIENDPDLLSIGQVLTILPINGVYHTVVTGDSVDKIAKKYKGDASAIIDYELNNIHSGDALTVGQKLIVPEGKKPIVQRTVQAYGGPIPANAARGTMEFGWPVSGVITQKFWSGHLGIDIGAPLGTRVLAADSGFVIFAGWDKTGYGNFIAIDHGNGFVTTYGHFESLAVNAGDSVKKGQVIGRVGSTGRSTGPHLDFRIRQNGAWRNPFLFLK
ncbi:MAG: peptidoglycan DD-metalloendopeptidase family protein [Chloroflexi bacterium]|nr:peptidoglycan DD-metalloendopeptidase family protein [Chloroflexota bacterium]